MVRLIQPPRPPPLPAQLPFEQQVDRALNRLAQAAERNSMVRRLQGVLDRLPQVSPVQFPAPLGTVTTPPLSSPNLVARIDQRRKEALKAAAGEDLAQVLALVPLVGDAVADTVEDHYGARIQELLTPEEYREFQRQDKVGPSFLAMYRTLSKFR